MMNLKKKIDKKCLKCDEDIYPCLECFQENERLARENDDEVWDKY